MGIPEFAFFVMAGAAVACAFGMVSTKNPIHAALWLVGNFVSLAVIFLILSAPMLFAIQLIVYAGAIMVLFLFVIMFFMAPQARQWLNPPLRGQLFFGGLATLALFALLAYGLASSGALNFGMSEAEEIQAGATGLNPVDYTELGQPKQLSLWMFTYQVLPFELTSLLLLAALLGAMMVARDVREEGRGKVTHYAAVVHPEQEPLMDGSAERAEAELVAVGEGEA
jgi:NADH-quinone oxidoreductase subunit J